MSNKNSNEPWIKRNIGLIVAIVTLIVAILAWLFPNPFYRLSKESDKTSVSIQQKYASASAVISKMDSTEISQEALQVYQTMMDLSSEYQLVNKYIKHKKEISSRRYLKSLSTIELVKLAMDEKDKSGKLIREVLIPSFSMPNELLNQPNYMISDINYRKLNEKNEDLMKKLLSWKAELEKAGFELNDYMKTFDPYKNKFKPERKLFKICKKSIYAEKEVEFLEEWNDYIEMYVDYLSELQEYYIQNQSNNN